VVDSPLTPPTPVPQPWQGQRGVFLTLRFQESRGGHFVPLGGAPGAGSGRLTGVVYLDTNENGRFDAGESGAPNITVILDGRFSTRTDANGRFDFPAVAAGHHVLTVQQDNLPLPWTLVNQGRTEVDVGTRDRVDVNIGAMRLK
jgi:SdrD B-like domain